MAHSGSIFKAAEVFEHPHPGKPHALARNTKRADAPVRDQAVDSPRSQFKAGRKLVLREQFFIVVIARSFHR